MAPREEPQLIDLIGGYYAYQYEHLDDLRFIRTPEDFLGSFGSDKPSREDIAHILTAVEKKFREAGWEGDGTIGVIWLPPFVDTGIEDTWGTYLWHVKQSNNGTSFVLSHGPLQFQRIRAQNEFSPRGRPVSIVDGDAQGLISFSKELAERMSAKLTSLQAVEDSSVAAAVREDILAHTQGMLVRELHEFLDHCYLRFLIDVINDGNPSKIKIRRSRVQLEPHRYAPEDMPYDNDANQWFTLQGVITDMWAAYRFEPYRQKLGMLFSAVDFEADKAVIALLNKHVALRNCIQHHGGQLDKGALDDCGVSKFQIKSASGSFELNVWKMIVLTEEELMELSNRLEQLAIAFNAHVFARVSARTYVRDSEVTTKGD